MIKLRPLICEIIAERMSYEDLMRRSDVARKDRGSRIPARSLVVKSVNDREAWKFSYKTPRDENTTGNRHQGFIYFFKEWMDSGDDARKIPCSVDCSCPDYKYRFSYANKAQDAGENGASSLNKGLDYPSSINRGPGLCKHLISLKEYLRTKIEKEPESSPQHQTIQPPKGTPVVIPAEPDPGTVPPEKAEEPEKNEPEVSQDPTQTPEPEVEPVSSTKPVEDPTQTPQEPEKEEPEDEKEPIKEWEERIELFKTLDEFCKKNPIFII